MAARSSPVAAPKAARASASEPASLRRPDPMQRARAVMSTTPLRFPRCAHLRASAEFQAVFGEGKRVSGAAFRLHVLLKADATQTRLGVTVSKRVDKAAVRRNRLRRQIKEAFRMLRATLQAGD